VVRFPRAVFTAARTGDFARSSRRSLTLIASLVLMAIVTAACHSTPPPPPIVGPMAVRIVGPIHTDGASIVDAAGRTVRFNGIGVRDYVTVGAPSANCVTDPPASEASNIAKWGFNSVRIPLAWADIEPTAPVAGPDGTLQHTWNTAYLANLDRFVQQVTSKGVAVFFTIHNKFGSNTDKGQCNLSSVPSWLYPQGAEDNGKARCEFLSGITQHGAPEPIWDGYAAVWSMLAERYKSNPQVVAADLVNEPFPIAPCNYATTKLADLYQKVGTAVQAANPHLALILEDTPPRLAEDGKFQIREKPTLPNVIYSYHLYQPNWDPDGKALNDAYAAQAAKWNVPLLVGEFNAFGYAAPGAGYDKNWQSDTVAALRYWRTTGVSWMAWAYSGGNHLVMSNGTPRADLISAFQRGY
jgi:endoglucanase